VRRILINGLIVGRGRISTGVERVSANELLNTVPEGWQRDSAGGARAARLYAIHAQRVVVVVGITCIAEGVSVCVYLIGVGDRRTVIARITDLVRIAVRLVDVLYGRAVVAGVADSIAVAVQLAGIHYSDAVVDAISNAIAVRIQGLQLRSFDEPDFA